MHHARFHWNRIGWFSWLRVLGVLSLALLVVAGARADEDEPCGDWYHETWIPGDVSWTADANGDPQATISDAIEICTWDDPCEGTTKDPHESAVSYDLLSDEVFFQNGRYVRQYTWIALPGCIGGDPTTNVSTMTLPWHWEQAPAISGGALNSDTEREVFTGGQLGVSVDAASDNDTWHVFGGYSGQATDTVHYEWSASGGSFDGATNGNNATWIAPQEPGTYTLTCTIDDEPAPVEASDFGSRDDTAITRTITVTVKEPPQVDLDIGAVPDESEEDPGEVLGIANLKKLSLSITPSVTQGQLILGATAGAGHIRVWKEETKENEVALPATWVYDENPNTPAPPSTLWVEGLSPSGAMRDVELTLSYKEDANAPPLSQDIVKITVPSMTIEVRREGQNTVYASSAILAAGAKSSLEHKADVRVTVRTPDGNPVASGVHVDRPVIEGGEGVPAGGGYDALLTPESLVTAADGTAMFEYRSSNRRTSVTLRLKDGADNVMDDATLSQHWDDLIANDPNDPDRPNLWVHDPYFFYGVPALVAFNPKFLDGGNWMAITNHTMNFKFTTATVLKWNGTDGYDEVTYSPDAAGQIISQVYPAKVIAQFTSAPENDSANGSYKSNLLVAGDSTGNERVYSVSFKAQDADTND